MLEIPEEQGGDLSQSTLLMVAVLICIGFNKLVLKLDGTMPGKPRSAYSEITK